MPTIETTSKMISFKDQSNTSYFLGQLTLEQLDANTKKLEDNLIELLLHERDILAADNSTDLSMEFMIAKSFPDTINKKITSNIPKIAGSFLIMFIYVCLSLGNLSCVENRVSPCLDVLNNSQINLML